MNRNIILSCGHYEEEEGKDPFGHTIMCLDYDDVGKDCITTSCVCSACLPWYQENFTLFSSVEEGFKYIEQEKKLAKYMTGSNSDDTIEAEIKPSIEDKVLDWISLSDSGMRLRCGEMTAQEIRTVRAVLNSIVSK